MSLGCWRGCRVHTRHGVELHKGGKAALVWSVLSLHRKPTCVEQNCSNMVKKHFVNSNPKSPLVNIATQSLLFRMLQNDKKIVSSRGLLWCYFLLSNQRIKINNVSFSCASLSSTDEASQSVHPKGVTVVFGNISVCIRQLLLGKMFQSVFRKSCKVFLEIFAALFGNVGLCIHQLVFGNFQTCIRKLSPVYSENFILLSATNAFWFGNLHSEFWMLLHSSTRNSVFAGRIAFGSSKKYIWNLKFDLATPNICVVFFWNFRGDTRMVSGGMFGEKCWWCRNNTFCGGAKWRPAILEDCRSATWTTLL